MNDRDRRLLDIAATKDGLIVRADVTAAKLSSAQWVARVEAGIWLAAAPGVWHHCARPLTWEMRLRAGLRHLGKRAAIFGTSAAAWWELDDAATDDVEFVVPRAKRYQDLPLRVHTTTSWSAGDVLTHRGLRVTSVTRTILDLAATRAPPRLIEAAIDSGVRKRLTAVPVIVERAQDIAERGPRGTALVFELLLDAGGESRLERRFLALMRSNGLPRPRCQVVHRSDGKVVARVDFQFERAGIVVEVSGRVGHASDRHRRADARRRNQLWLEHRLRVIEFTTADVVEDPEYVVATITTALAGPDLVAS